MVLNDQNKISPNDNKLSLLTVNYSLHVYRVWTIVTVIDLLTLVNTKKSYLTDLFSLTMF